MRQQALSYRDYWRSGQEVAASGVHPRSVWLTTNAERVAAISQFYSENLGNEVKKGFEQKAKAGGTPTRAKLATSTPDKCGLTERANAPPSSRIDPCQPKTQRCRIRPLPIRLWVGTAHNVATYLLAAALIKLSLAAWPSPSDHFALICDRCPGLFPHAGSMAPHRRKKVRERRSPPTYRSRSPSLRGCWDHREGSSPLLIGIGAQPLHAP